MIEYFYKIRVTSHSLLVVSFLFVILHALVTNFSGGMRNLANVGIVLDIETARVSASHVGVSSYLLGVSALQQNELKQAISLFKQAWFESHPFARQRLAESNLKAGDWQGTLDVLNVNYPNEREYYKQILVEHLPKLSPGEHKQWRLQVRTELPESMAYFANSLLYAQHFEEAENWAKGSPTYAHSSEEQAIVGASYFYRNRLGEAARIFASVYQRQPNASHAYWYGRTLLYMGQPGQAVHLLEVATELEQSAISLWYLHDLSQAYVALSRCRDAESVLDLAFSRRPDGEILVKLRVAQAALTDCK